MALSRSILLAAISPQNAWAENGAKATYFNVGKWSGYSWMSSAQPAAPQKNTDDECGPLPPACWSSSGFACGPGDGSAGGKDQIKVDGDNMVMTCSAKDGDGKTKPASSYAQLYMSNADVKDGEQFSQKVMNKQQKYTYGDFVWYIDHVEIDGKKDAPFPNNLVIGLYLYAPNMKFNGGVDCTHELDVEFANWGKPLAFTSWPGATSTGKVDEPIRYSQAFELQPSHSCVGMRWEEGGVTYFRWPGANAAACTQSKIEECLSGESEKCIKSRVPYSNQKGSCTPGTTACIDTQITDAMTPSMNLWSSGPPNGEWSEAKLTLGAFHYFPVSRTQNITMV
jgi:hypothetical protein